MIYVIDNDRECSDHRVHFVEAGEGSNMERVLALTQRAYPRTCYRCGAARPATGEVVGFSASDRRKAWCVDREVRHAYYRFPFPIAKAERFEWYCGRPQSFQSWLEELPERMSADAPKDWAAARELVSLVRQLAPGAYFDEDFND